MEHAHVHAGRGMRATSAMSETHHSTHDTALQTAHFCHYKKTTEDHAQVHVTRPTSVYCIQTTKDRTYDKRRPVRYKQQQRDSGGWGLGFKSRPGRAVRGARSMRNDTRIACTRTCTRMSESEVILAVLVQHAILATACIPRTRTLELEPKDEGT